MPKIPDVAQLGPSPNPTPQRGVYGYAAGLEEKADFEAAQAIGKFGQQLGAFADFQEQQQTKLETAYAQSSLLKGQIELEEAFRNDPDYSTFGKRYNVKMAEITSQSLSMISNPQARELFNAQIQDNLARGQARISDIAFAKQRDVSRGTMVNLLQQNQDMYLKAGDEATRGAVFNTTTEAMNAAVQSGAFSREEGAKIIQNWHETSSKAAIERLPPEERVKIYGAMMQGKTLQPVTSDEVINHIIDNFEGTTLVSNDGGKGASKFGINQTANPDVDIATLTRDKAVRLYKERYWNAIGADSLPENMRLAAMDTAVNFGPDKAKKMIAEADGDPAKLAQIRMEEHERLLKSDPKTYGKYRDAWATRDQAIGKGTQLPNLTRFIPQADVPRLYEAAKNDLEKQNREVEKAAQEQRDRFLSDMDIGIERGQVRSIDVEDAYQKGLISPAQRADRILKADKKAEEQAKKDAAILKVEQAGRNGIPLDPKDKEVRTALDDHFDQALSSWKDLQPNEVLERSINYAFDKGLVPEKLQSMIRGRLRSGQPEQALQAVDTVKKLRVLNPQLLDDLSKEDVSFANSIAAKVEYGVPPAEAIRSANEPVTPALKEARKKEFAEKLKSNAPDSYIEDKFNSFWRFFEPDVDPVMRQEFTDIAADDFQRTGDYDASMRTAADMIGRVWGQTDVGSSRRYMKHPPELIYGIPTMSQRDNAKWMNEQLLDDLAPLIKGSGNKEVSLENILLLPNPKTSGNTPTYLPIFKDSDGILRNLMDETGAPVVWVPDWSQSKASKRKEEENKQELEELSKKRKKINEPLANRWPVYG